MEAAGRIDPEGWARENYSLFQGAYEEPEGPPVTIAQWVEAARIASGDQSVELAAAFQRHLTARGTGLPSNFALALTPDEVIAFKFNPRNVEHPIHVNAAQFKKEVGRWPRGSVRFSALERGRMAWGATLEIDGSDPIPCRMPTLTKNPAAAVVLLALGADPTTAPE
jgi:hypothetical protein